MEHVNVGKDKLHIALQLTSMDDSANIHLLYFRGYLMAGRCSGALVSVIAMKI